MNFRIDVLPFKKTAFIGFVYDNPWQITWPKKSKQEVEELSNDVHVLLTGVYLLQRLLFGIKLTFILVYAFSKFAIWCSER